MKKLTTILTATLFLFACKKETTTKAGVFKGPEASVYHGKAWSSVKLNEEGNPEKLTLTLNDDVLNSVQVGMPAPGEHTHENEVVVQLHPKALAALPFQFFMVNWNPNGHPPVGIYDKPHFDFHLYMTASSEVATYTDTAKLNAAPVATYLPAGYIPTTSVPKMGRHWMDVTSPELHGQAFAQTFVYGSYNGNVVFYEPMITLDFLKNTNSFERAIPQPVKFQKAGYYPTTLRIVKHDGVTDIVFDGFSLRQAT